MFYHLCFKFKEITNPCSNLLRNVCGWDPSRTWYGCTIQDAFLEIQLLMFEILCVGIQHTYLIIRIIRMNKKIQFWKSFDHMSLSRDRIWHYFSMKPYTEIATTTFVLDKNRTEKKQFSHITLYDINFFNQIAFWTPCISHPQFFPIFWGYF